MGTNAEQNKMLPKARGYPFLSQMLILVVWYLASCHFSHFYLNISDSAELNSVL